MNADFTYLIPSHIRQFEPYIPSKPDAELRKYYGCEVLHRLNNNENPLGPPRESAEIIKKFSPGNTSIYPSGDAYYVREKLSEYFGLDADQFLVGNGANEVISFVIHAFCQEGDNIITADKTFAVYEWVAKFSGVEARLIPLVNFGFDDEEMLAAIDERTKILFVCNPNNPTGSVWGRDKLTGFLDRVAGQQIVVVDEAYCEFVDDPDFPDGIKLIEKYPNLVVFRTFSKMFGLAGLRIGYLAGHKSVVDVIRRTCIVYSVNGLAQAAAAAAIGDEGHILSTRQLVREGKAALLGELEQMGLEYVHGQGNFVMIRLPISDSLAHRKLMTKGFMVRSMTGFRCPNFIRVTINQPDLMVDFARALREIL